MVASRCLLLIAAGVLTTTCSGCYQTPQQKLIGRWYNGDMSIRFRPDGSVVYNSGSGLSRGRYDFQPTGFAAGSQSGVRNLVVETQGRGRRSRYEFEAVFLAHDRLRLHDLSPHSSNATNESIHQFALLKRASESQAQARIAP